MMHPILPPCGEGGAKRRMGDCRARMQKLHGTATLQEVRLLVVWLCGLAPIRLAALATFPARGKDK